MPIGAGNEELRHQLEERRDVCGRQQVLIRSLQTQLKAAQVTDAAINLQLFGMPVL
jgi:hypothetical protein